MDEAYNQHSNHARRGNRSATNLTNFSLAPFTTKLPLTDDEELPDGASTAPRAHRTSYLQGKSAPTTPSLLSRSPVRSRSHSRRGSANGATVSFSLPKSKSTTHLSSHLALPLNGSRHRPGGSGTLSPTNPRRRKDDIMHNSGGLLSARDRNDSDWMLRAGALLSGEYREYKGQGWLVSRASSTSLTGAVPNQEAEIVEAAFERALAREREHAAYAHHHHHQHQSRRGSVAVLDDDVVVVQPASEGGGSRVISRAGSRSQILTPGEQQQHHRSMDGYFPKIQGHDVCHDHQLLDYYAAAPDFVNLNEKLESIEQDTSVEDEAHVRRLVKREQIGGSGFWFGNVLGWRLFSVEENEEEEEDSEEDSEEYEYDDDRERTGEEAVDGVASSNEELRSQERRRLNLKHLEGITNVPQERLPPPKTDEGGWHDAAWLLSVATKVLL